MFNLTICAHFPHERMPDADTDVLVWEEGQREAQLGAYVGHDQEGPVWVNAQGEGIKVAAWCEMPMASQAPTAAVDTLRLKSGGSVDLRAAWRAPA